ncbi:MAG: DNA replication/repair protein RecF [Chitinophagales bacterium]
MYIQKIKIVNFKNYEQASLRFSPKLNVVVGSNGTGKTNLLDAIYYMCFCKSYFNASDNLNIRHNTYFFRIESVFVLNEKEESVVAKVGQGRKKEMRHNQIVYKKLSEHIGLLPLVMIAPDDVSLIKNASEERRKLIDSTLCQLDSTYLANLIQYNKLLKQRNATLKSFVEKRFFNATLLQTYDERLIPLGKFIHFKRKEFVENLMPILQVFYKILSQGKEKVACIYKSHLNEKEFGEILKANLMQDKQVQRTTQGIHRDDLLFSIDGYRLKKFGSQGQQKSFLLALKLAIYRYIQQKKQQKPILLLDDIFDKLDLQRIEQLISIVTKEDFGQVFISDTQLKRIKIIFDKLSLSYCVFEIKDSQNIVSLNY